MRLLTDMVGRFARARIERQAAHWLACLHADRCDDRQRASFRAWLAADTRHAAVFEELTSAWEVVGAADGDSLPRTVTLSRRSVLIGGSAALTAAAGGFVAISAGAEDYETSIGESRSITLADRSKVLLDADSHLRVRTRESGCEATLKRGRAHFDLRGRSGAPLIVRAGGCDLRVDQGTFEIERVDARAARIVMLTGSAQVDVVNKGFRQAAALDAGQIFDETLTAAAPVAADTIERFTAWRNGRAIFSNDTLTQAVATMNRYDRQRLVLEDQDAAELRISGTFRLGDNAAFADALRAMLPVEVGVQSDSLLLRSRAGRG